MSRLFWPLVLAAMGLTFAVETNFWTFSSSEDHEKSTLKGLSLRSDGRIALAPEVKELHDPSAAYLWAIARGADGTLYTGGGDSGATACKLVAVSNGRAKVLGELPGLQIQSIALDPSGRVYAATAPDGKVYRMASSGEPEVFYDPKAKYIWSIVFDRAGNLYVGTGDRGEIHKVDAGGNGTVFFKTEEEHARSMAMDPKGNLMAGTEPGGLIIRIGPAGEGFVVHQAERREITALAIAADGSVYASAVGSKRTQPFTVLPPAPAVPPAKSSTTITVTASASGAAAPRAAIAPPVLATGGVSGGSEVIRIGPDGFPSIVWSHASEIVYSMTFDRDGNPILGTGNKGAIYRVDSDLLSTRLVNLAPTQVTALTRDTAGAIFAVTGNIGKLFQIGPGLEKQGTLESETMDAGWFAEWGRLTYKAQGTVAFETRSGNLDRPQKNWSDWAPVKDRIASPAARFLQYRAKLSGPGAAIVSTDVAYLPKNMPPRVERIEITPANYRFPNQILTSTPSSTLSLGSISSKTPAPPSAPSSDPGAVTLNAAKGHRGARWMAGDANADTLRYDVEIRGLNEQNWKPLKKDLLVRQYSWDSSTFTDGEYTLRVTARDDASNPPGKGLSDSLESAPFTVDHTPPAIRNLAAKAIGNRLTIAFSAADASSILTRAEYSINGGDWIYVEPSTRLSDAKEHTYSIAIDRPAGELSLAVKVTDEFDNHSVDKTVVK